MGAETGTGSHPRKLVPAYLVPGEFVVRADALWDSLGESIAKMLAEADDAEGE